MTARSHTMTGWMAAAALLAGGIALSGPAHAADMALRGSLPAYEDTGPNWGGVYLGAFGGLGTMNIGTNAAAQNYITKVLNGYAFADASSQATAISNITRLNPINASPKVFGAFFGYQAQYEDAVIGVEFDYTRLSGSNGGTSTFTPPASLVINGTSYTDRITPTTSLSASLQDYWTARVRGGWAFGRVMPFITGGIALARGSTSFTYSADCVRNGIDTNTGSTTCIGGVGTATASERDKLGFGFAVGTGVEALVTNNIFLRAEYQYLRVPSLAGVPVTLQTVRAGLGVKY